MAEKKGFAFETESKLLLPPDFVDSCRTNRLKAEEILGLLEYFSKLGDTAEYLTNKDLESSLPESLVMEGFLLRVGDFILPGTPKGRSQAEALRKGTLKIEDLRGGVYKDSRPNVFRFYEDNIGPLTPHIAELIKADLLDYPTDWLVDAMKEASKNNARKYPYIQAILKNWKQYGRNKSDEKIQDSDKFKDFFRKQHGG